MLRAPSFRRLFATAPAKGPVHKVVPPGDSKERLVCLDCDFVLYKNPLNVVGTLSTDAKGRILLARRAIEPRRDLWTLPAGFMELGESVDEGAAREAFEETDAVVKTSTLIACYSVPAAGQVHMFVGGTVDETHAATSHSTGAQAASSSATHAASSFHGCGVESLETRFFHAEDIPWERLAFPTVRDVLLHYLKHRASPQRSAPIPVDFRTIREPLPKSGADLPIPEAARHVIDGLRAKARAHASSSNGSPPLR